MGTFISMLSDGCQLRMSLATCASRARVMVRILELCVIQWQYVVCLDITPSFGAQWSGKWAFKGLWPLVLESRRFPAELTRDPQIQALAYSGHCPQLWSEIEGQVIVSQPPRHRPPNLSMSLVSVLA